MCVVLKMEQERVSYMTFEMRLRDEWKIGWQEGREEGREEGKLSMIRKLLREAVPVELIQRVTGWTKEQILAVQEGGLSDEKR